MKNPDRLYDLLPVVYRSRDAEQGYPLRALLRVIGEQVDGVENDIAQLYENWFIETCEDWVVPYIGDLIGHQLVHEAGEPGDVTTARGQQREQILIPRQDVANTIRARRRKGTLALLELLANDVAEWPARVVEFYRLLGWTQHLDHQRPQRGRTVDLCNGNALALLDGPFDRLAHTVDVRRINSQRAVGRYNIPSVGAFVWRLRTYSVSKTQAYCQDERPHRYTFSVLGTDTPLFNNPQRETDPTHIAVELNLPTRIRRRAFEKRVIVEGRLDYTEASEEYYGVDKSLVIWAPNWPKKGAEQPLPSSLVIPADLNHWHYHAPRNRVAVDPETGRIVFPASQLPKKGVAVYYQYAFSADIGGGEYDRSLSQPADARFYRVAQDKDGYYNTINAALQQWVKDKAALLQPAARNEKSKPISAVIEIVDGGVYTEPLNVALDNGESLQIRGANRARPIIRLLDYMADRPDAFSVTGKRGSRFTLDGLLIAGRAVQIYGPERSTDDEGPADEGDLCDVTIRHCTLVPGWSLHCDCEPCRPNEPSLEMANSRASIKVEHSILGSVQVVAAEIIQDPIVIQISDSILDATRDDLEALSGSEREIGYARLTIARSTVIGKVLTHEVALAENCIFSAVVTVARRQSGCVRFCYVPPDSRTPRRYECQPDLVVKAITNKFIEAKGTISVAERDTDIESAKLRVEPEFNSIRYGTPTYCQLAEACAEEIKRGADDESEMGAFHDLYQPQRAANLRARLDAYTPAGMDPGIIYAT